MMNYYILEIVKNKVSYYVLWYTNDNDGFVINKGRLVSFENIKSLQRYCEEMNIFTEEEIERYDLAKICDYLATNSVSPDCELLLNFWNLSSDLSQTIGCNLWDSDDMEVAEIYDKLFHGSNLPAINKSSKTYIPIWSSDELELIDQILKNGLNLFSECLEAAE